MNLENILKNTVEEHISMCACGMKAGENRPENKVGKYFYGCCPDMFRLGNTG